jgi:hypothetical protein
MPLNRSSLRMQRRRRGGRYHWVFAYGAAAIVFLLAVIKILW